MAMMLQCLPTLLRTLSKLLIRNSIFFGITRGVTVSGVVGLLKPDIAIYRHHATTFDLDPPHCLFIDDSIKNVEGAINAGWQAVHFKNAETLKDDLERFGIEL